METNEELKTAVGAWCADEAAAETTYGHISSWDTRRVTDMSCLFGRCWDGSQWETTCETYKSFNADISSWDGKCGEGRAHHLTIS